MKDLPQSQKDLADLLDYIIQNFNGVIPFPIENVRLAWDREREVANEISPRAFCAVLPEDETIYCAKALEELSPAVRLGVLLHEVGHLWLDTATEPLVDEWIINNFPEANYSYTNYPYGGRIAINIQRVSGDFVRKIKDGRGCR